MRSTSSSTPFRLFRARPILTLSDSTVVKVSFPLDNSKNSQSARLTAASITLQNLNGPGKGCPVVSTTFSAQQQAINAEPNNQAPVAATPAAASPPKATTPAPAPSPAPAQGSGNGKPSAAQVAALAPSLGFQSGLNPTGTGDCDGAVKGEKSV